MCGLLLGADADPSLQSFLEVRRWELDEPAAFLIKFLCPLFVGDLFLSLETYSLFVLDLSHSKAFLGNIVCVFISFRFLQPWKANPHGKREEPVVALFFVSCT